MNTNKYTMNDNKTEALVPLKYVYKKQMTSLLWNSRKQKAFILDLYMAN